VLLNNSGKNVAQLSDAHSFTLTITDPRLPEKELGVTDMFSGMWHMGFGHDDMSAHEDLALPTIKYTNNVRDEAVAMLCELFGYKGVVLGLNGSDATDAAIRIAQSLTGRTKVLALEEGYHGCTMAAALAGRDLNRRGLPKTLQELFDGGTIGRWAFMETVDEKVMEEELGKIPWSELGVFIFEPVQGSAGGWRLNPLVYEAIARKCHEHGAFVIADEIMTGIGRCGHLALTQTYQPQPDMLLLGKMLGNGVPVSAVLVNEAIASKQLRLHRTGYYTMTNAGNLAGCKAILQTLKRVTMPGFLEEIREKIEDLEPVFHAQFIDCPGVKSVRSYGLFLTLGVSSQELADMVHLALLIEDKYSVDLSGQKLRFCPALTMSARTVKRAFAKTEQRLRQYAGETSS